MLYFIKIVNLILLYLRKENKLTENSSSEKLEIIVKMNLILIRKLQNYH